MPIVVIRGQTDPPWNLTMLNADNNPINLTGIVFNQPTLYDPLAVGGGNGIQQSGTFLVINAAAGTFTFTPASNDLPTRGEFIWECGFTLSSLQYYARMPVTVLERYAA